MRICNVCGAIIGNGNKHMRRKRCEKHKRIMEARRTKL